MSTFNPIHFHFSEWKECFNQCRALDKAKTNYQLVISTHWATEGYWVEPKGNILTEGDHLYTGKKVYALESRVEKTIADAKTKNSIGIGLIR